MSLQAPAPVAASGASLRVGLAAARYNDRFIEPLLAQVVSALRAAGVKEKALTIYRVPGTNELPTAAQWLAAAKPDVVIALGVVIRGDTLHYELISYASAHALQRVALDARLPVINGVVVVENEQQAEDRCLGRINRGEEFARAALEMATLGRRRGKGRS